MPAGGLGGGGGWTQSWWAITDGAAGAPAGDGGPSERVSPEGQLSPSLSWPPPAGISADTSDPRLLRLDPGPGLLPQAALA